VLIAGSTKEMVGLKNTLVPRLGQTSPEAQGLGFRFRVLNASSALPASSSFSLVYP
jgi:hypothetical protein